MLDTLGVELAMTLLHFCFDFYSLEVALFESFDLKFTPHPKRIIILISFNHAKYIKLIVSHTQQAL